MSELSVVELRRERAAKNQSLFREVNERIEHRAGDASFTTFICECCDPQCDASVALTLQEYEEIRADPNRFLVLPGHDVAEVEEIVEANDRYVIVRKSGAGRAVAELLDPRRRQLTAPRSSACVPGSFCSKSRTSSCAER